MPLSPGTRLGPYEIVGPLGKGGMGEVYRAIDTGLKRQVAIKNLPVAALSGESMAATGSGSRDDRLSRFQREAEVLASLNHPHIAAVYGLQDTPDGKALVMELVEGPTLADRIARAPIPLDEALSIARQIAEALEAAHEQGIVHRDLKPANIKVRPDGTVKVLDFGLAKLTEDRFSGHDDPSQSPTITGTAETAMGVILGTAAYMSPEQARGQPVDKRTDVWAFGAVLYEMLTRARAFPGDGIADTIASVVKSAPEWTALPADVPPPVVALVQRCLEKDRRARIGDMAVARFLLSDHATTSGSFIPAVTAASGAQSTGSALSTSPVPTRPWRQAIPWAVTAVVVIASAILLWRMQGQPEAPRRLYHMVISGGDQPFRTGVNWEMFAISADGTKIVYSLVPLGSRPGAAGGTSGPLYVRRLDEATAKAIPGTEGAVRPILSPDGQWVAFTDATNAVVKRVPIDGGTPTVIADNMQAGGTWARDNTLVLARQGFGLVRVAETGGSVTPILAGGPGGRYVHPQVLPDGSLLFTTIVAGQSKVGILPAGTTTPKELVEGMHPRFVPPGYLIFARGATLFAATFDPARLELTGQPVPVLEGVLGDVSGGHSNFSVSDDGSIAYIPGPAYGALDSSVLVWLDRSGANEKPLTFRPQAYGAAYLSADAKRIVTSVLAGTAVQLWVGDVERGTLVSVTADPVADYRFSNDDRRVEYRKTDGSIWSRPTDLSGPESRLTDGTDLPGTDVGIVSPDGKWRVITGAAPSGKTGADVWTLDESNRRAAPKPWVQSATNDQALTFSPDGRWLLYATTNPTGVPANRNELFIQPFPGPGAVLPVSQDGVRLPVRWVGQDIIFRDLGGGTVSTLVAARVTTGSSLTVAPPKTIMQVQASYRWDDVTRDGQRFLFRKDVSATSERTLATELHVIVNWIDDVKQKTAAAAKASK